LLCLVVVEVLVCARCAVLCCAVHFRSLRLTVRWHQAASRDEGQSACVLILLKPSLAPQYGIQLMLMSRISCSPLFGEQCPDVVPLLRVRGCGDVRDSAPLVSAS